MTKAIKWRCNDDQGLIFGQTTSCMFNSFHYYVQVHLRPSNCFYIFPVVLHKWMHCSCFSWGLCKAAVIHFISNVINFWLSHSTLDASFDQWDFTFSSFQSSSAVLHQNTSTQPMQPKALSSSPVTITRLLASKSVVLFFRINCSAVCSEFFIAWLSKSCLNHLNTLLP